MKRAMDFIQGIAELQRGVKKVGSVLGAGKRQLEKAPDAKVVGETTDGGMTVKTHIVRSINERVGFITHMIRKGRDHPKVRAFAAKAVSQKCEGSWCVDEGDYENEIRAVFDALRENVRYVRDTYGKDLFQHPARTLEFGAADCLPAGTLLIQKPYDLVPIEHIVEGDEIVGDGGWVRVQKTWSKGVRKLLAFDLNNGSVLRCTPDHKLFVASRDVNTSRQDREAAVEVRARDIRVGDDLLQPENKGFRPSAHVRAIRDGGEAPVHDVATSSGRIYLAEHDVVVHNCDDYTITICAALGSLGYPTRCRVIRTAGASDYNHIYALVGLPPRNPTKWVPLDASIAKPAGWEPPAKMIADKRDFRVD